MEFAYDDGGRAAAGFKGSAGDCMARAIAIAAEMPYEAAYGLVNAHSESERPSKRRRGKSSARTGVHKVTARAIMAAIGWTWVPTMGIGTGCTVHLKDGELPSGRIIALVSKHYVAVIDGVIRDTHDPQRNTMYFKPDGTLDRVAGRCVYGYWKKA